MKKETYYQPIPKGTDLIDVDGNYLFSFMVYRSKRNAQRDFPDYEIGTYYGEEIEDHEYID